MKRNNDLIKLRLYHLFALSTIGYWVITDQISVWAKILIVITGIIFARIGSEAGFHRYFTHRSYQTTKFKERMLLWWGTFLGIGSCISWANVHRLHHADPDTEHDPHVPWLTSLLTGLQADTERNNRVVVRDLLRDNLQILIHKNYFKIVTTYVLGLVILSIAIGSLIPLMVFFSIPNVCLWLLYDINIDHLVGYRTYNTKDRSTNSNLIRLSFLGTGLHNNHHYDASKANLNFRKNWWEWDFDYFIIKYMFMDRSNDKL